MRLIPITPETPTAEPLSLIEAAHHLRLISSDAEADALPDKALILGFISAAREAVENYTNRAVKVAIYELIADNLGVFYLPKPPFIELVSIQYTNAAGVLTPLPAENYSLLEGSEPMYLVTTWPSDFAHKVNGVRIRFKCGYLAAPASLKSAMLLLIGHLYENREEVTVSTVGHQLPKASEFLMHPFRVYS